MKTKAEIATQDYMGKFNCAQSTIAQFAEKYGLDEKTALRMGAGFGGGCHYGEACGSVISACAVIGLKHGHQEPDPEKYNHCREKIREFMALFTEEFGTARCSDLLGVDMVDPDGRSKAYELGLMETRCKDIVTFVVNTLEKLGY